MPAHIFKKIVPAALHIPDSSVEKDGSGNSVSVELPGKVQLGFEVDGQFVPMAEIKAGKLLRKIEAAKSSEKK